MITRKTMRSAAACRSQPMPVFLISFNRGYMLNKAISSIKRLSLPTEIIIHDNGSTDPATLSILEEHQKNGIKVYRNPAIACADELNQVNETIEDFFAQWREPVNYVVSDCDIDLSIADPLALNVYAELLNTFEHIDCVGPMLRICDIPRRYPLFNHVMNRHIEQFWRKKPTFEQTSFGRVAVLEALIDTTFALHRAGEAFRRLKNGIRVYAPFEALHLDWYEHLDVDNVYLNSSSQAISHWNNKAFLRGNRDAKLEYFQYYAVRRNFFKELEVYSEFVLANG